MNKEYMVKLSSQERKHLNKLLSNGNEPAKKHKIARILLGADESRGGMGYTDEEIADEIIEVSTKTIGRIRKRYAEGGLEEVFRKRFTPRYSRRKFDGEGEAHLVAICCSEAPEGRSRWTLRLLSDKVVECEITETASYETIRRTLKKTNLNHGKRENGAFPPKRMGNLSAKWKTC